MTHCGTPIIVVNHYFGRKKIDEVHPNTKFLPSFSGQNNTTSLTLHATRPVEVFFPQFDILLEYISIQSDLGGESSPLVAAEYPMQKFNCWSSVRLQNNKNKRFLCEQPRMFRSQKIYRSERPKISITNRFSISFRIYLLLLQLESKRFRLKMQSLG